LHRDKHVACHADEKKHECLWSNLHLVPGETVKACWTANVAVEEKRRANLTGDQKENICETHKNFAENNKFFMQRSRKKHSEKNRSSVNKAERNRREWTKTDQPEKHATQQAAKEKKDWKRKTCDVPTTASVKQ
jgi:hypothetical protein